LCRAERLISLRFGSQTQSYFFPLIPSPNIITVLNKLYYLNLKSDPCGFRCIFCHGRVVSDQAQLIILSSIKIGHHFGMHCFLFFFIIGKIGNSRSRYLIFEISGKPSFVDAVLWRVVQIFYLLCSQFRQKASSWINKTLLLIKQQKWLSEFCVKIDRVASKN
jgi:hypothetical protein